MQTYLFYKNQMQGLKSVSNIVGVTEKSAASFIHLLKYQVNNLNTYLNLTEQLLIRICKFCKEPSAWLLATNNDYDKHNAALIILSSNKGLVGSLWHNIAFNAKKHIKQYKYIIIYGKQLLGKYSNAIKYFDADKPDSSEHMIRFALKLFKQNRFSSVDVLYPSFVSISEQVPNLVQFLPFKLKYKDYNSGIGIPIFCQKNELLFNQILLKYVKASFRELILETKLSEFSARTVAMEHAGAKIKQLVKQLNLNYVKERRKVITQHQIESFMAHKML